MVGSSLVSFPHNGGGSVVFSWWAGMGHPCGFAGPPAALARRAGSRGPVGPGLLHLPPHCTCSWTFSRKTQGSWSECCKKTKGKLQDLFLMSTQNITSASFYSNKGGQLGFMGGRSVRELGAVLRGFLKGRVFRVLCSLF